MDISDKEKDDILGCFIAIMLFVLVIPIMLLNTWMILLGYNWVVLPIFTTLPVITFKQAFGLFLFSTFISNRTLKFNQSIPGKTLLDNTKESVANLISVMIFEFTLLFILWLFYS